MVIDEAVISTDLSQKDRSAQVITVTEKIQDYLRLFHYYPPHVLSPFTNL